MHGKNVHGIVLCFLSLGDQAIPEILIINDMITSHQSGQVEGLARRIKSNRTVSGILADALRRRMMVSGKDQVRPDLIGDHHAVIRFIDFHGFLDLPFFPDTATGIVRAAENCHMDLICLQFCVHILIIHAPYAVFIFFQRAVYDMETAVNDAACKTNIGRTVKQHTVPRNCKSTQRGDHATKYAVLIADVLFAKAGNSVPFRLPADNGIKIFF